jgi:hypothetical protein
MLTALIIVVLVVVYYVAVFDPEKDPCQTEHMGHLKCEYPNPVDRIFLKKIRGILGIMLRKFPNQHGRLAGRIRNGWLEDVLIKVATLCLSLPFTS